MRERELDIVKIDVVKHYVHEQKVGAVFVGKYDDCLQYMMDNRYRRVK